MIYHLNLREVTYALSEALDYVGIDDTLHGKRVAFMAAEVAKKLNWPQQRVDDIVMASMLHDCGVSSTDVHSHLVTELDWNNSQTHCQRGAKLLQQTTLYQQFANIVLYHHTHWDSFASSVSLQDKENANLIYLVDRLDALHAQIGDQSSQQRQKIVQTLANYSGTMFSPEFVLVLQELAQIDYFWFTMEATPLTIYLTHWIEQGHEEALAYSLIKNIAIMFANIVDAKSEFTSKHTYGVAAVAKFLAEHYGLTEQDQNKIELAGFFHDLGKLKVSDAILQKNAPLTDEEHFQMNRHGFDSGMILNKIKGFQDIARIASLHHETLDGKGYPYHLTAEHIPIEARIVTIADIFQALVQNRPYRAGMSAKEALTIMAQMTKEHKLDERIILILSKHLEEAYLQAIKPETTMHGN